MRLLGIFDEFRTRVRPELRAGSLAHAVLHGHGRCDDQVVAYLESGHIIFGSMAAELDVISKDDYILGSGSILTDGNWVWLRDLPYYLKRYGLALPGEFIADVKGRNGVVPTHTRQDLMPLIDEIYAAFGIVGD